MQARQDLGVARGVFVGEYGTGTGVTIQSSRSSFPEFWLCRGDLLLRSLAAPAARPGPGFL